MTTRMRWLALGVAAVALGACSDNSIVSPPARGLAPHGPSLSATLNGNSFTLASDAGSQYCPNEAVLGFITAFPGSQPGITSGCIAARDVETDGSLGAYNPGWPQLTGGHWIGFTVNSGPSSDYRPTPGRYAFQQTFTLPASVTNPSLSLNVRADNVVAVYLNGHQLGAQQMEDCNDGDFGPCNWTPGGTLHVTASAADFVANPGVNYLTFLVIDLPTGYNDPVAPPAGKGGPAPQYGCTTRTPQPTGSHLFTEDNAVSTEPAYVGGDGGTGHPMVPTPTENVANPTQHGCENPVGLAFVGSVTWTPGDTPCPAGTFTFTNDAAGLHIRYDQFPAPNDNSYGVNAVGWPNGHKFSDLTGSDHAGIQLKDQNGVVRLAFNVDYISAVSTAPSGYASLGPNGGDGKMLVGTSDGITSTSSLANNLNNINIPGLFNPTTHAQLIGSVNVLVNSPPTDAAHTTYNISDPALANWDFHDTYYVDISPAKLAAIGYNPATWTVEPALDQLHNSPAKPCPPGPGSIAATQYEVKDKQVKITVANTGSADIFLEALTLNWPAANGALTQIKLDGDVVYNVSTPSGPISLTTAQLVADPNKRKLNHNSSDVYTLIFANNADANLAHYTGTVTFGGTTLTVLPH